MESLAELESCSLTKTPTGTMALNIQLGCGLTWIELGTATGQTSTLLSKC